MSNKYGDKVDGIKVPKAEQKQEVKVEEPVKQEVPVTDAVKEQQAQRPRPNSNFSRTLDDARPTREIKSGSKVSLDLTDYLVSMRDARNPEETAKAQMKLYNVLKYIVTNKDFTTFSREWTELLNFANNNREDMNLISISRAVYLWPLDGRQQKTFSTLALLALLSADPKTRRKPNGVCGDTVLEQVAKLGKEASYNIGAYYTF